MLIDNYTYIIFVYLLYINSNTTKAINEESVFHVFFAPDANTQFREIGFVGDVSFTNVISYLKKNKYLICDK